MKISVIVPVFNVESYIENTLNSLVNQSIFDDIEVIIIDDGSTDNSKYLIEKFSVDYDNIHTFHKENEGLTFTRNYGIDLAKGEYVHFMDSDDYISPDTYEKMYGLAKKHDHDIVSGHFLRFDDDSIRREVISRFIREKINDTIESTTLDECPILAWDSVVWNKLYKTSFLKEHNIKFPYERITYEDNIFSIESYCKAKSIGFLDYDVYYWRERPYNTSLSTQNEFQTFIDRYKIMKLVDKCMKDNGCSDETIKMKYLKWLKEDLKNMTLLIPMLESDTQKGCFDKIIEILNLGPINILDELDDYYMLLYRIVLNGNTNDLIEFNKNHESKMLSDKFGTFDFKMDFKNSPLNAYITDIESSKSSLFLRFRSNMHSFDDIDIGIIHDNASGKCRFNEEEIIVDLNSLEDGFNKIFISYVFDGVRKEGYMKTSISKSLEFDDYIIDIGFTLDGAIYIHKRLNECSDTLIDEITFDGNYLMFSGNLSKKISLINTASLDEHALGIEDNGFVISYMDLLKSPVKKWQLISNGKLSIDNEYVFFKNEDMISISNISNKITINLEHFNQIDLFKDLQNKLKRAYDKNRKLYRKNKRLKSELNQFKREKPVNLVDKIRGLM